ncbi:hypothetical protein HY041_00110, partial [Candidatus Roizmanbacteria bacterium]|nr:hypothetical protein [Candidatus Roizmanbacteria bacterium]
MKIKLVIIIILFAVLGYIFVYQPYRNIKTKALVLVASAKEMKNVFSKNDIDLLHNKLKTFSNQYSDFEKEAKTIYWATFIPYVSDFKNGVEAGNYLVKAADESIIAVTPYADLIGFKK